MPECSRSVLHNALYKSTIIIIIIIIIIITIISPCLLSEIFPLR